MGSTPTTFPDQQWAREPAESQGLDADKLKAAGDRLDTRARKAGKPYRAMVIRRGVVVDERAGGGADPAARVPQASAGKSTFSCLLAIAVAEGRIASPDDRVCDYYPAMLEVPDGRGPKPGRFASEKDRDITFRQLISNTSGYLKPDERPGRTYHYQTFGMNILCHAIAAAYQRYDPAEDPPGPDAASLIEEKIRDPIGGSWTWDYMNFNHADTARTRIFGNYTQMHMTIEDMARLGWLWINRGRWQDRQIVPETWIDQATRVVPEVRETKHQAGTEQRPERAEYGYGFWSNQRGKIWPSLPRDAFSAQGSGAKCIWCCPSLELVALLNPGLYSNFTEEDQGWIGEVVAAS